MASPGQHEQEEDKLARRKQQANDYLKYSGMAFQMGIIILVGVLAGRELDRMLGSKPYLTVAMSLLSIVAALYSSLKDFFRPNQGKDQMK